MHAATIENLASLPSHSPGLRHMKMLTSEQWLFDGIVILLPKLLELAALIILVLIPWNTAW